MSSKKQRAAIDHFRAAMNVLELRRQAQLANRRNMVIPVDPSWSVNRKGMN